MNSWRDDLYADMLVHDGQPGQKWGRRRYRNYDGTLTPAGRERYGVGPARQDGSKKLSRKERKAQKEIKRKASAKAAEKRAKEAVEESKRAAEEARQAQEELRKERERLEFQRAKEASFERHVTSDEAAQRKTDAEYAKQDNNVLQERINRIKLDRSYNDLMYPENPPPQKKKFVDRAVSFVDSAKKIVTAANDVYKIYSDIKKGFQGGDTEYDQLKRKADMDKFKYDIETRNVKRQDWEKAGYKVHH